MTVPGLSSCVPLASLYQLLSENCAQDVGESGRDLSASISWDPFDAATNAFQDTCFWLEDLCSLLINRMYVFVQQYCDWFIIQTNEAQFLSKCYLLSDNENLGGSDWALSLSQSSGLFLCFRLISEECFVSFVLDLPSRTHQFTILEKSYQHQPLNYQNLLEIFLYCLADSTGDRLFFLKSNLLSLRLLCFHYCILSFIFHWEDTLCLLRSISVDSSIGPGQSPWCHVSS